MGTNKWQKCIHILQESLGGAQEKCVESHAQLLKALFTTPYTRADIEKIMQVLPPSLWVYLFYTEKSKCKSHSKNYNSTIHSFHSDLVITFLALKCQYSPPWRTGQISRLPVLPTFKNTIIHHGISPQHPIFQGLILQQMVKIIYPDSKFCDLQQQAHETLAGYIHWYFIRGC